MVERSWTIIQFLDEDMTIEAVPTTWLQGDLCHWPPYQSSKMSNAIRKWEALNTNWPTHKVKVFRNATFGKYSKKKDCHFQTVEI